MDDVRARVVDGIESAIERNLSDDEKRRKDPENLDIDSLERTMIAVELEKRFDISIPDENTWRTLADVIATVNELVAQ